MSDSEFYSLQPRQLDLLRRQREQLVEDQEFLFGQLTAYVINFSHRGPKDPVHAKDFMPSQMRKKIRVSRPKLKRRTRAVIEAESRRVMSYFMRVM